jgi:hypothetical protein
MVADFFWINPLLFYICPDLGSAGWRIKREVRCESGAIPVAVSSFVNVRSTYHCPINDGKVSGAEQARRPARFS